MTVFIAFRESGMDRQPLGKSGIFVSKLGLGTVKFGRNQAVKYPESFLIPEDQQILTLLSLAKEQGINLLDTAPAYGKSEERLGQLLGKTRKDWVIITKVGEEFQEGNSHYNFTPEHARFSIERSLKRLKTDYLDGVLVHSDGNDVYNLQHFGILEALEDLKKQGLILTYGASTKTVEGGMLAVDQSDFVMLCYNPSYTDERSVIEYAAKKQKGVLIKKALMSGHLNPRATTNPIRETFEFIFEVEGISSVIVGTINPKHLLQNCQALPSS